MQDCELDASGLAQENQRTAHAHTHSCIHRQAPGLLGAISGHVVWDLSAVDGKPKHDKCTLPITGWAATLRHPTGATQSHMWSGCITPQKFTGQVLLSEQGPLLKGWTSLVRVGRGQLLQADTHIYIETTCGPEVGRLLCNTPPGSAAPALQDLYARNFFLAAAVAARWASLRAMSHQRNMVAPVVMNGVQWQQLPASSRRIKSE